MTRNEIDDLSQFKTKTNTDLKRLQQKETIKRYQFINNVLKQEDESKLTYQPLQRLENTFGPYTYA